MERGLQHSFTKPRLIGLLLLLTLLLLQFFAKMELFIGLAYTSDLFNLTQGSISVWIGRPIFFENCSGAGSYTHNYFFMLLLGPLQLLVGAHGFFIVFTILSAIGVFRLLTDPRLTSNGVPVLVVAVASPFSFWLFDDPIYGWHNEFFYFPLTLIALSAYLRGETRVYLFLLMLITLVKEDGAVLACSLHLLTTFHQMEAKKEFRLTPFLAVTFSWLVVFILGLLLLNSMAPRAVGRLSVALDGVSGAFAVPAGHEALVKMACDFLVLLFGGLGILAFLIRPMFLLAGLFVLSPVVIVQYVSSLAYYPDVISMHMHGLTWPARWASVWSICMAVCYLGIREISRRQIGILLAILCVGIQLPLQAWALERVRDYSFLDAFGPLFGSRSPRQMLYLLTEREQRFLTCVRDSLPHSASIVTGGMLFGIFHRHDIAGAGDEKNRYKPTEVFVCDRKGRFPFEGPCLDVLSTLPSDTFEQDSIAQLAYASRTSWIDVFRRCELLSKPERTRMKNRFGAIDQ